MDTDYKIIGGDGQEYGPVPLPELRAWIQDGRVARSTQLWSSQTQRWRAASTYEEVQPELDQVEPQSASRPDSNAVLVGFLPRLGAWLIDGLVLNVLFYLLLGAVDSSQFDPKNPPPFSELLAIVGDRMRWEVLVTAVYTVALTGQFGATLGKMAIGARIVAMDGTRIGFGKALLRWLASILSGLTLGAGYLMVAFRGDRRALHDLLVGTQVIRRK